MHLKHSVPERGIDPGGIEIPAQASSRATPRAHGWTHALQQDLLDARVAKSRAFGTTSTSAQPTR